MELALTPSGRISLRQTADSQEAKPDGRTGPAGKGLRDQSRGGAFPAGDRAVRRPAAAGILLLAGFCRQLPDGPLPYARNRRPGIGGHPAAHLGRIGDADLERPADARRRVSQRSDALRRLERLGRWTREAIAAGGEGLVGLLEAAGRPCGTRWGGSASTWPKTGAARNARLPSWRPTRPSVASGCPRPVSAAQQGPAGVGRRQEQTALVRLLSPVQFGLAKERPGERTARIGRPLPAAGLDAPARPIASSRTRRPGRERHSGAACPTGGRNVRGPASA